MTRRMGKQDYAILCLPSNPEKHIYWVVYNEDMVKFTEDRIKELRGDDFMTNITVVAKGEPTKDRSNGSLYFDPLLMDYIGNGQ